MKVIMNKEENVLYSIFHPI